MLDKKYLDKFSSEKKRLTPVKVDLSSIDSLEEARMNVVTAGNMIEEFSSQALRTQKLLKAETNDAIELVKKIEEMKSALADLINNLTEEYAEFEDSTNTGYRYGEDKTGQEFKSNAEKLGIDPKSVKEFNDYMSASEELFEILQQSEKTSNLLFDTIDEAKDVLKQI